MSGIWAASDFATFSVTGAGIRWTGYTPFTPLRREIRPISVPVASTENPLKSVR